MPVRRDCSVSERWVPSAVDSLPAYIARRSRARVPCAAAWPAAALCGRQRRWWWPRPPTRRAHPRGTLDNFMIHVEQLADGRDHTLLLGKRGRERCDERLKPPRSTVRKCPHVGTALRACFYCWNGRRLTASSSTCKSMCMQALHAATPGPAAAGSHVVSY